MLAPHLLPSELVVSGAFAAARINGYSSISQLTQALPGFSTRTNARVAGVVADFFGLSAEQLVQQHSLLPFLRLTAPLSAENALRARWIDLSRTMIRQARVCPDCAREDLSFWGRSYFRIEHQLPGVHRCYKHERPLWLTSGRSLAHFPNELLGHGQARVDPLSEITANNAVVARYQRLAMSVTENAISFDLRQLQATIKRRSRELGLSALRTKASETLSLRTEALVPARWLAEVLPTQKKRFRGRQVGALELTERHVCTTPEYLLALAVLFDSADSALNAVFSERVGSKQDQTPRFASNFWDEGEGAAIYRACQGEHEQLIRAINMDRRNLRRSLHAAGYPMLSRFRDGDAVRAALKHFESGGSLSAAAAACGLPVTRLEQVLRISVRRTLRTMEPANPSLRPSIDPVQF